MVEREGKFYYRNYHASANTDASDHLQGAERIFVLFQYDNELVARGEMTR